MIVERDVIGIGEREPLVENVDPSVFVDVVIFQKIADRVIGEFEGCDVIEKFEERAGLGPLGQKFG